MIEKCRESASNNTSPKANKTGSSQKTPPTSQASVPAKESNEQLIKEIPVRNAQQTPSSPATPGSYSPKGDNSSVPPKSIPPYVKNAVISLLSFARILVCILVFFVFCFVLFVCLFSFHDHLSVCNNLLFLQFNCLFYS